MAHRKRLSLWFAAAVTCVAVSPGCGGDDTSNASTGAATAGPGGGGGAGTGGTAGNGPGQGGGGSGGGTGTAGQGGTGTGGTGGQGGGTGGGMTQNFGPPATETVNAGEVSSSPNYRMVFTLGQPSQSQGTTTSPSYRMQGGLVGANGSLP